LALTVLKHDGAKSVADVAPCVFWRQDHPGVKPGRSSKRQVPVDNAGWGEKRLGCPGGGKLKCRSRRVAGELTGLWARGTLYGLVEHTVVALRNGLTVARYLFTFS